VGGIEVTVMSQLMQNSAYSMLHDGFLLDLFFDREDGEDMSF
jgi:hypothetical protein